MRQDQKLTSRNRSTGASTVRDRPLRESVWGGQGIHGQTVLLDHDRDPAHVLAYVEQEDDPGAARAEGQTRANHGRKPLAEP